MKLWLQVIVVTALAAGSLAVLAERSGDFRALWLTPDQQGRLAYEDMVFSAAADLFEDALWKGGAAYAAGRYLDAAQAFARIPTAEGFYNRGNALMKGREYKSAIQSYEQAVVEAPDWPEAAENLKLARYVLDYIERVREQSDPGKQSLGADDVKYDNTEGKGKEIVITKKSTLEAASAEKWMRSVDTDTRDFLRTRFALEAAREGSP
jgi:Ca-activated chloride channel family protein